MKNLIDRLGENKVLAIACGFLLLSILIDIYLVGLLS